MDRRAFIGWSLAQGACVALPAAAARAAGETLLKVGVMAAPSSLDPHFQDQYTLVQAVFQIYSPLISQDHAGGLVPGLATSWKALDDTTWELRLRPGVKFHDGTPFVAEDLPFSFNRVLHVPGAIAPFTPDVRGIVDTKIVEPYVVHVKLSSADPLFPYKMTQVCMLSHKIHAHAVPEDFNSGKMAIGTGPFRYAGYSRGEKLELTANPSYFGGKPDWDRVLIRYIVDPGTRIAALSAGEVDLIDSIPVQDVNTLAHNPKFEVFSSPAFHIAYLAPDCARDKSPYVFDNNGKPLDHNPLKDLRVRQALTMSIDRQGIVNRLMNGQASVADQFAALSVVDRASDMSPIPYDLKKARQLLADAGYPDGFRMTIHGSNGWFANDANVLQAVAQGFSRIGVKTSVEVLPTVTLSSRARERAFSVYQALFASAYALVTLRFVCMTKDMKTGNGTSNDQLYSNPKVDAPMLKALVEMDFDKRKALIGQAMHALMDDVGLMPLFYMKANWAGRRGYVRYEANSMSRTSVFYAHKVGA